MMSQSERQVLLVLARGAIAAHVNGASRAAKYELSDGELNARSAGVFVTLHKGNQLRGCIGHIEADEPLSQAVTRCAVAACSCDPRFPPLARDELAFVHIEISVLGALEPVSNPADIDVGVHGLLVEKGGHRGLLLPQVATEWKWDRAQFFAQTCRKAGLPPDAWKSGMTIWRFEAEVFGEPLADE
jgi:AmmeMemoRadiSam system protein A